MTQLSVRSKGFSLLTVAALAAAMLPAHGAPVHLVDQSPVAISTPAPGVILVDFGKAAYGNVRLTPPAGSGAALTVHFGEKLAGGRIDRKPPGTVRYAKSQLDLSGAKPQVVAPPVDKRNIKQPGAVLTPPEWGVVMPFRWLEIEGWPGALRQDQIVRQAAFATTWDDHAAEFKSSDEMLNRVWELCRYSIKATTFAGVYVDGDRERVPYEADAYLNQLGHYACDPDVQMARDTYDRLMAHPTWPTEWASHMVLMAHADWMHTGDSQWLAARYEALKTKLLLDRARPDGLIVSGSKQIKHEDIIDWPRGERDGYESKAVNTVVNAFHLRTLACMAELAAALGKTAEAANYAALESKTRKAFQEVCFDAKSGVYRDGEGTDHASQHASFFPLAFGLVPADRRTAVAAYVAKKRMACSVYGAQYMLEGLFQADAGSDALALITAKNDRSWKHMVESGTTMTWEAWDMKYKANQDWNHAWGAAPANLLPRFVLGAQVLAPGWKRALIRPNPGNLKAAEGKVPTPRGPILVSWKNQGSFNISVKLPEGVSAKLELPATPEATTVTRDGKPVAAKRLGARLVLDADVTGTATFEVR